MAESPLRQREEDDKQKTMKESYNIDTPSDAIKIFYLLGHHRYTAQQQDIMGTRNEIQRV